MFGLRTIAFFAQKELVIDNPGDYKDIHDPLEILYNGRKNYEERERSGRKIKLIPFGEFYFVKDGLTYSLHQNAVITERKPRIFAKTNSTETIGDVPVKIIKNCVYSEKGTFRLRYIDDSVRNNPKLLDAESILKIAKIKSLIANGLDESFFNLNVDLQFIDYDRPFIDYEYFADILFLDQMTLYKSQTMREEVDQFQTKIFADLMEKTHDPARYSKWCLDEYDRNRLGAIFDMSSR
jgi:hypothetical protein